ncbi:MAG: Factor arrest protein 11 [Pycnora praestabilis]|nr:MAG: Factor arrest protein 11 [Pycnora praestabilis]
MEGIESSKEQAVYAPIIVKADEVDAVGANISLNAPTAPADTGFSRNDGLDVPEVVARDDRKREEAKKREIPTTSIMLPARPQLRREQSQPVPLQQPRPPQATQEPGQPGDPTDSLSLMQLRRIVTDMPRMEPTAYAFTYQDTANFLDELNEWFSYTEEEIEGLMSARTTFEAKWKQTDTDWTKADPTQRMKFIEDELAELESPHVQQRSESLEALLYIGLGVWGETGGLTTNGDGTEGNKNDREAKADDSENAYRNAAMQMKWMMIGAETIYESMGVQAVFDVVRGVCMREWKEDNSESGQLEEEEVESLEHERRELGNAMSMMYLLVEAGRKQLVQSKNATLRNEIAALEPDYLIFLVKVIAQLRWEDSTSLPLRKILLLFWKSLLLLFGSTQDLDETKAATREDMGMTCNEHGQALITASPLDYHLFRQEITSKYPAYNPPPPLIPLELENSSILPPLANHPSRNNSVSGLFSGIGPANVNSNGGSILHQPVHIATPAPSPPPSPAGPGGKAGKKQNYQTNQNFPFLYPPLDNANSAGGIGSATLQEILVGRKWDGSDIPASILEAGKLFASRMRMTRSMKQLWEERERFMKFERGWGGLNDDGEIGHLELNAKIDQGTEAEERKDDASESTRDQEVKRRLDAIEGFYRKALPHFQSLVIVLLKEVLTNVTALVANTNLSGSGFQNTGSAPLQDSGNGNGQIKGKINGVNGRQTNGTVHEQNEADGNTSPPIADDLEGPRSREITAKAVSGMLLLLLKWFKVSHILKYEYLAQLLLDSNYLPLVLKLFAHQDLEQAINPRTDKEELRNPSGENNEESESEDDACPPPISRNRQDQQSQCPEAANLPPPAPRLPEVDELGYPTSNLPSEPITSFSWRNFFSAINYLRIMQKICKRKAHRNLLLVQYKSSTILKKNLKIPQPDLRLYTLKLFKNQVPYCGRKWRQSNMRVITAVYLHCRPELRDDWLAGSDVDAEVEEALPLEQALRALTHWHNLKRYPEQMGAEMGVLEEEQDFFVRELAKMDWGMEEVSVGEEAMGGGGSGGGGEGGILWQEPLQMEGW